MHQRSSTASIRAIALALLLLTLASGLGACAPLDRLPGRSGPTSATPEGSARPRLTPVATVAGPPAPTPIAPLAGALVPERTLVFASDRGGQIDLWLMDIATGRLVRLTNDTAIESFPTWSPDGTMIAYVVEDEHAVRNLWVLDLRTGIHRQLTHEEPPFDVRRPAWLRGSHVLIYDTGKPFDRRSELRAVTIDGIKLAPLLPDSGSVIWDWSTNGETIICAVGALLGQPRLVVADAVPGTALHPQPDAPVGFDVQLSPDGQYATFSSPPLSDDQITSILVLATGATYALNERVQRPTGTPEPVRGRRYEHDFAWLTDSRHLVFVHGAGGVTDGQGKLKVTTDPPPTSDGYVGLWLTDRAESVADRQRDWLTTGSADAAPRPSPDGAWIAFLSDTQNPDPALSDIWLIAVDAPGGLAREKRNLTYDHGNNWAPAWMPIPTGGPHGT